MNLLHIDSSISGKASASRQLSVELAHALHHAVPGLQIVRRDLESDPLPHLDHKTLSAAWPGSELSEDTRAELARNAAVLDEFMAADVLVLGAPMYNFAIPSQLKAWIDRIAIAGKTFRYTQNGPEGLVRGKKVFVVSSRGGLYAPGTPQAAFDFQETYLRAVFAFIGINDVEFLRAEGLGLGPEQREEAILAALNAARTLAHKTSAGMKTIEAQKAA